MDVVVETKTSSFNTNVFLTAIFLGRICQGLYLSILSPTLLFLAGNVEQDVAAVAPVFTGRAVGFLTGSILAGFLLKYKNPLMLIGFGVFCCGAFLCIIPFVKSLPLLAFLVTFSGLMTGNLDGGLQGIILNIWGEKHSRIHIQAFHFAFTIGAFFAPLIAKPFLEMASLTTKQDARCPHANNTAESDVLFDESATQSIKSVGNKPFSPITYAYFICSFFTVSVSLFFIILARMNIIKKIKHQRKEENYETEDRDEETFVGMLPIIILLTLYYFCVTGGDHPIMALIYAIAVCSQLHFSTSNASLLNSVFWAGYGAGRLVAVPISNYLHPKWIIWFCLFGCVISMTTMSIFGQNISVIMWITTFFYGFFSSPLFPAGVSWVSGLFNISGKYVFVINFGNAIGSMSMVAVAGAVFQREPFSVVYFSTGMAALNCIVFLVMVLYGMMRVRRQDRAAKTDDDPYIPEEIEKVTKVNQD